MPNETLALAIAPLPVAPGEDDYRAICAALSESERGRAFLAEYARRNRHADTQSLLAAIERLEARLQADGSAVQRLRDDLRMLLIAIRLARPEIDAGNPATQAAKLSKLLDLLERRIDAMSEANSTDAAPDDSAHAARATCRGAAARRAGIADAVAGKRSAAAHLFGRRYGGDRAGAGSCRSGRLAAARSARRHHGAQRGRAAGVVYVISFANKSASTLPPERMPTTTLPLTSSLPASSAARPMAPPGSTTSFSSRNA